jgi:hypothetical protein
MISAGTSSRCGVSRVCAENPTPRLHGETYQGYVQKHNLESDHSGIAQILLQGTHYTQVTGAEANPPAR